MTNIIFQQKPTQTHERKASTIIASESGKGQKTKETGSCKLDVLSRIVKIKKLCTDLVHHLRRDHAHRLADRLRVVQHVGHLFEKASTVSLHINPSSSGPKVYCGWD